MQTNENSRISTQYRCHFRSNISGVVGHSSACSSGSLPLWAVLQTSMLWRSILSLSFRMVGEHAVNCANGRRREAAGFFYFRRLRRRRAPLVAATSCRPSSAPQRQRKPPEPREANRRGAHEGLAMLESLVDTAFSADTRLGTFLQSVASKETAAWDVVSGKLGVFPCSPPTFAKPGASIRYGRRVPRRVRMRILEKQLTGMIISVLSFQILGRPRTAPATSRMGSTRTSLQKKAVASVGAQVRAFVRDTADIAIDRGSGRKA